MLTYLPFCTCLSVQSAHTQTCTFSPKVMETTYRSRRSFSHCKIQVSKQSWMSVLSFLQRFRFTYRSNAVQSFGRNFQEYSQRCSLLQWEQVLWLWPDPWSTAIQGSWLWRLTSEGSVSCTPQEFKLILREFLRATNRFSPDLTCQVEMIARQVHVFLKLLIR